MIYSFMQYAYILDILRRIFNVGQDSYCNIDVTELTHITSRPKPNVLLEVVLSQVLNVIGIPDSRGISIRGRTIVR